MDINSNKELEELLEHLHKDNRANVFLIEVLCDIMIDKFKISKEELETRFRNKVLLSGSPRIIN